MNPSLYCLEKVLALFGKLRKWKEINPLSQYLKELKEAGMIQGEIEAPKIRYCLNNETWTEAKTLFKNIFLL